MTGKRTGPRYLFDDNGTMMQGTLIPNGAKTSAGAAPSLTAAQIAATGAIYGATAQSYWQIDLDARVKLDFIKLGQSYLQLNVFNLTNSFYVGGFGGGLTQIGTYNKTTGTAAYANPGFVQIGAPRTVSGSIVFKY